MITALIAAALSLSAAPAEGPGLPDAEPALWVVNDHDTVIYLFGTFHALDGRSAWFNDEVKTAFRASNELMLETLVPATKSPNVPQHGSARYVGPLGPYAGSASYLSTTKMVMSAGREQGMSTDQGADWILRKAAEDSGKPVGALETFDFQLRMFSSMPGAPKPSNPAQAAAMKAALAAMLTRLQAAWNRGDVEGFTPMLQQMRASSPRTYKMMFADRNARWAGWIARRLQQPGTVFVAVGAGHLAGDDSVQQKLAGMRIRTERIN